MSCSPFDLRDYILQELTNPQQLQVEAHTKTCTTCREEVERLRATEMALFTLRDEEIPQRFGGFAVEAPIAGDDTAEGRDRIGCERGLKGIHQPIGCGNAAG